MSIPDPKNQKSQKGEKGEKSEKGETLPVLSYEKTLDIWNSFEEEEIVEIYWVYCKEWHPCKILKKFIFNKSCSLVIFFEDIPFEVIEEDTEHYAEIFQLNANYSRIRKFVPLKESELLRIR